MDLTSPLAQLSFDLLADFSSRWSMPFIWEISSRWLARSDWHSFLISAS